MLLQWGNFKLHSGEESWWRIDCDAFSDSETALLAKMIREKVGPFTDIRYPESHPGSFVPRLAKELIRYKSDFTGKNMRFLIVDDVLTTGNSMAKIREDIDLRVKVTYPTSIVGAVIFARGECPYWITPIFQVT